MIKGRAKGDKRKKFSFSGSHPDYSISILHTGQNERHSDLTWARRVRNWGSRYFSEPRKNERIKSLKYSFGGIISWQSHWAEWSEHYDALPSLRKRHPRVSRNWAEWAPQGQSQCGAAQAPEKAAGGSISIQTPFLPLPFLVGLPLPPVRPNLQLHPSSAPSDWPGSSPHCNLWSLVGFGHFSLSRPSEIPDASNTARVTKCWNEKW